MKKDSTKVENQMFKKMFMQGKILNYFLKLFSSFLCNLNAQGILPMTLV